MRTTTYKASAKRATITRRPLRIATSLAEQLLDLIEDPDPRGWGVDFCEALALCGRVPLKFTRAR